MDNRTVFTVCGEKVEDFLNSSTGASFGKKDVSSENEIRELSIEHQRLQNERLREDMASKKKKGILEDKITVLREARENIQTCSHLDNILGICGIENIVKMTIESNLKILEGIEDLNKAEFPPDNSDSESDIEFFKHIDLKGLKKAISMTNIMDIIRKAKKGGWDIKLGDDEVALYKDGKRINGDANNKDFVTLDPKAEVKTEENTKVDSQQ